MDFARREFSVRRTIQRIKNTDGEGEAKTVVAFMDLAEYANRRIPLPNFLLNMLSEHKSSSSGEYVISLDGSFVEPRTLQYRLKKLLQQANVLHENFQTLRHASAVRALKSNFQATRPIQNNNIP